MFLFDSLNGCVTAMYSKYNSWIKLNTETKNVGGIIIKIMRRTTNTSLLINKAGTYSFAFFNIITPENNYPM